MKSKLTVRNKQLLNEKKVMKRYFGEGNSKWQVRNIKVASTCGLVRGGA